MKNEKSIEELKQLIALYEEARDFANTKSKICDVLAKFEEVKLCVKRLEEVHNLAAIIEEYKQQGWILKEYFTLEEAAIYVGVSKWTIRRMSQEKAFPIYKPGRGIMIKKDELLAWIESNKHLSKEELEENARRLLSEMKQRRAERIVKRANKKNK